MNEWFDIDDKQPDNDTGCLCWSVKFGKSGNLRHGFCLMLIYENGKWYDDDLLNYESNADMYSVTHWMYEPDPPKIKIEPRKSL